MKVAIADDDPIVCSSLATILAATGAAEVPWTANSGEIAMSRYAEDAPDVLLIDVQMPGMDGLTASERILHAHPDARILVLTTFADEAYIAKAMEIGTKGYLIKQDVSSVIPAVQAVMAGQVVMGAEVLTKLRLVNGGAQTVVRPNESGRPQGLGRYEVPDRFANLTDREHDVAELVAEGLDNREIAAKLFLSEGTVRNRISDILAKTNISNRTKLAVEWLACH
ncbi:response regulator transcription factor [Bifidobacterium moukalabense]|uniref:response regulator transcription factor n=1 Tax=Bifidobacterium moukalabense TaxID=1333651 RepID=UPI0010F5C818|nr:response regulator transcription factor [Bifidobacterium moukalabense]